MLPLVVLPAALLVSVAARTLAPAPAPSAAGPLGSSWAPSAAQSCSSVCGAGRAYAFGLPPQSTSSLCAFTDATGATAIGFESSTLPGVCQSTAGATSSFWCRCLEADQVPGLALAQPGDLTCDSSCAQALPGIAGTAVGVASGSQQRVCLAHSDIGSSNRFRSTAAGTAQEPLGCRAGAETLSGAAFSCACQFTQPQAPPALPRVAGDPRVAAQSVGAVAG